MTLQNKGSWHTFALSNGLRVAVEAGPDKGLLSIQMRYRVGSRDEAPNEWGFAHLVEHLLCRHPQRLSGADYHDLIRDAYGTSNATTGADFTKYYTTVPVSALGLVLRLEAQRMADLVPGPIQAECDVIASERQWMESQDPCGLWEDELHALAYPSDNGYHHSILGAVEHLTAVTPERIKDFHQRHYAPNNALLAIAGGADVSAVASLVEHCLGVLPARPVAARIRLQPASEGQHVRRNGNVSMPRVFLAYPAPPLGTPEYRYLDLLGDVLVTGRTSRLAQALRTGAPMADYWFRLLPGTAASLVVIWATVPSDVDPATTREWLGEFLVCLHPPTPAEIQRIRAVNRLRRAQLFELSSERADRVAEALDLGLEPAQALLVDEPFDPEAMARAAELFRPEHQVCLEYVNPEAE